MPDKSQQIIQRMVKKIARKFDPDKIILFGSYARGEVTRDSDIDLLVIMPVAGSKRHKAAEIGKAIGAVGIPKDILVFTPEDVVQYGHLVGTILKPALKEGKVLYERKS
jgi:predicted nucleotidyltransferase